MTGKKRVDVNWEENENDKGRLTDSVKDVITGLIRTAPKLKDELGKRLSDEIMKLVSRIDLVAEGKKFLESHKVIIKAEVEFKKKDEENSES